MRYYLILIALLLFTANAKADLSQEQLAILHTDMVTNPEVLVLVQNEDDLGLSAYYSTITTDLGWVSDFSMRELFNVLDWQEVISRSVAERDTLQFMFSLGSVDSGQSNVRQGFADIFSGGQASAVAQRAALVAAAQRLINRVEKVLSTSFSGTVYTLGYEGELSVRDAAFARTYQP